MVKTENDFVPFQLGAFSRKGQDFLKNSNYFINVAEGAVRSGKTVLVIIRFINAIIKGKGVNYAIIGRTLTTVHNNVVTPMLRIFSNYKDHISFAYYRGNNEIIFWVNGVEKTIYLFGADNVEAENKIAGLTLQAALIDEAARIVRVVFEMVLTRLSEPEAKAFVTTNPDNSMHWLKTDYIDNTNLIEKGKICTWTFYLSDNLSLTREVVDNITEACRGNPVLYARLIESKWVSSTGLIYSHFNLEENTFKDIDLTKYSHIDIGCDYASSNVNVFTVVGTYIEDGVSHHDILDEIVFDAQKQGSEQSDTDRCNDLFELQEKYNLHNRCYVYVPHDATSLKSAIYQDKRLVIGAIKVKPDTLEYIYTIQDLFYQNRIRVYNKCTETLRSIQSYVWDEKKVEKGEDYPDKSCYDNPCDAFRFPIIRRLRNRKTSNQIGEVILNI